LAFAVVFGLGLCNHNTMMLLGPVFLAFVLFIEPKFWIRWKLYFACTVLAVACLGIYAYIPIRSLANPPVDWGNPETWSAFRDHVTRAQYSFATKENPHSAERLAAQLWAFLKLYAWEFGPWLCWLPLVGLYALWKRERVTLVFLATIAAMTSLGIIWFTNFDVDRQSLWLNNVFWIPAYIMAAIGAGVGLDWLAQRPWSPIPAKRVAWGLALVMMVGPLALNYARNDKSDYFYAHDFGKNTLLSLEENAIYFPTADHATFPVLYYQAVEGLRPDITLANIYGYPEESLYADMPEDIRKDFGPIPNAGQEHFIEKWIIEHNEDRPVYFTRKRDMRDLPDYTMEEHGLVFAVRKKDDSTEYTPPWDAYRWYSLNPDETQGELTADSILADAHYMRGRSWFRDGEQEKALQAFDIAARLGPESKETMNNLGSACAEYGLTEKAMEYYQQCITLAPDYTMARKNLGQIYLSQGDTNNALLQFEAYLEESPDDPQVLKRSAECMARVGWYRDAITRLEYLLRLTPGDASVYKLIGQYYEEGKISVRQAHAYYAKSLEIDPTQQDLLAKLNPAAPEPEMPGLPDGAPGGGLPEIPGLDLPTAPGLPQIPTPGGSFGGGPQVPF
jgi:Flp pilus assembly protein TadD